MGPFLLVYWTGGSNAGGLVVYGGYTTYAAAEAALAKLQNKASYFIVQNFPPPPSSPSPGYSNQGVSPLNYVVIQSTFGLSNIQLFSYSTPFTTYAQAEAFLAQLQWKDGCEIAMVQTAL